MENQQTIATKSKINSIGTSVLLFGVIVIIAVASVYWLYQKNRQIISTSEYERSNTGSSYPDSISASALSTDGGLEH